MGGRSSVVLAGWLILLLAVASPGASAQGIFVTPVAGAPFSGLVVVERSRVQRDGSIVNLKTIRAIARDGQGRIHNELRVFVPASSTQIPELLHIHLYDPQTRISATINVPDKTFLTRTLSHPPSTEPPSIRYASPTGSNPPSDFTKEEDLGIHEIEGVAAHGLRETQTLPAGNDSPGKELVITDEYWYSEELRINLMIKHSDPRTGTETLTVSQIARGEPDPAFFQIPEGYKRARTETH
ncbi:MAG TPA: hypothetical protein VEH30_14110 [Terriglobales bacterium]|nr:hypothetical protein [Terriglobales bacterium]